MKDVIIIGAGIAGLSAGYELSKENIDFQILETSNKVGGTIETLQIGDYQIETGAHTFSSLSKETLEIIKELDLEDDLQEANPNANKRYVYCNGHLISVPKGPKEFFETNILSKEAKWTLLEELFIKKEEKEESVEDFISRRFGREVLKNLVQPYLNGVFAGDVKKLSASAVFPKLKELEEKYNSVIAGFVISSILKNSRKKLTIYSFKEGMEKLPLGLYEILKNKITLNTRDIEISRAKDFFIVTYKVNNKTINYTTNSILFAIPSYKMFDFNYLLPDDYFTDFFNIEYMPLTVVLQAIDKSKIKLDLGGFGFLCTKEPHRKLLGTIWTSSAFPNKAPDNKVLLTSYIGGAYFKKIVELPEEEIKNLVSKELCDILKISTQDSLETLYIKTHTNAIPQYNLGHIEKVKKIDELMDKNYGLFFTGNYLHGISINDTIKTSKKAVEKIIRFLKLQKRVERKQITEEKTFVTNT